MHFAVVIFNGTEEESVEIIRTDWLISRNKCFFPPSKDYFKSLKNNILSKDWNNYDMRIVKEIGKAFLII